MSSVVGDGSQAISADSVESSLPLPSLPDLLLDIGLSGCSSTESVREIFARLQLTSQSLTEDVIAHTLGMMARTQTRLVTQSKLKDIQASGWQVENFCDAVRELKGDKVDWNTVIRQLDHADFIIFDIEGFMLILNAYKLGTSGKHFPMEFLLEKWKNVRGQLSVLRQAIFCNTDMVSFCNDTLESQRVFVLDSGSENVSLALLNTTNSLVSHKWNCIKLFESLCWLSLSSEIATDAHEILDKMGKMGPEIVFLGLLQVREADKSEVRVEIMRRLFGLYLMGHPNSVLVLARLNAVNPGMLMRGLLEMYEKDNHSISRICDIAQDIKITAQLLDQTPLGFAMELAALAARREFLNLELWLQDMTVRHSEEFNHGALEFLKRKLQEESVKQTRNVAHPSPPLHLQVYAKFLRHFERTQLSAEDQVVFKEVHASAMQVYPRLLNVNSSNEETVASGESAFPNEIEAEVNIQYERVYRGEVSVEATLDLLRQLRDSPDLRFQQVFECMVHNLLDEYRFYPDYPDRELEITANLFGGIIRQSLVTGVALNVALQYVLDALRQSSQNRIFKFGVQALRQFYGRLVEWPAFCQNIVQIEAINQVWPEGYQLASRIAKSTTTTVSTKIIKPVEKAPSDTFEMRESLKTGSLVFTAIKLVNLENEKEVVLQPPEAVRDRVLFIINNLAENNLLIKLPELEQLLGESTHQWFAHYLVVKRASSEENQHDLYLKMLEKLASSSLIHHILRETLLIIHYLINSDSIMESSQERKLLKNLGGWLGGLTLAKDRPLLHKHIALKDILIQGYEGNRLILAIPFVCKVLEQGKKGRIFKSKNPWMTSVMQLLVELYLYADLKMNMKFEVEVLFNVFGLKLENMTPTAILRSRHSGYNTMTASEYGESPPFAVQNTLTNVQQTNPHNQAHSMQKGARELQYSLNGVFDRQQLEINALQQQRHSALRMQQQYMDGNHSSMRNMAPAYLPDPLLSLENLDQYMIFDPLFNSLIQQPIFKRDLLRAIDEAFKKVLFDSLDRYIGVACSITVSTITRDFALEFNEEKMCRSAHLMVRHIAGHMASVVCREPLKTTIGLSIRTFLQRQGWSESNIPDDMVAAIIEDNITFLCAVIKRTAADRAVAEIDELLSPQFVARRKHRERTGQPYYDMQSFSQIFYPQSYPDALKIKPTGLTNTQLRIYEEYARGIPAPEISQQPSFSGYVQEAPQVESSSKNFTTAEQQILERFGQYITELDLKLGQNANYTWSKLPIQHDIRLLVRHISFLVEQSQQRDHTSIFFAQKVVQLLYKSESDLACEVYVMLLDHLCNCSSHTAKEVSNWLVYADDERKYNVLVTVALMRAGLIKADEQDNQLGGLIDQGRSSVAEFAVKLIRASVLRESPIATIQQFMNTLRALSSLSQRGKASDSVFQLLEELSKKNQPRTKDREAETVNMRDRLLYIFSEWVRLYQHQSSNETAFAAFISQIQLQGWVFKNTETMTLFLRVCTETCVEDYNKKIDSSNKYAYLDAFSKLLALLVQSSETDLTAASGDSQSEYFTTILTVICLLLVKDHQTRKLEFDQRPYFRLLSGILTELQAYEAQFSQPVYLQLLIAFSNALHTIKPTFLPGFAVAWLALISHRLFMPKLLAVDEPKIWGNVLRLLVAMFNFIGPFLQQSPIGESAILFYKGILRVMLVLLHDFPLFLASYAFSFCDVIPGSCIQLRNMVLSALPPSTPSPPDPFLKDIKLHLIPEIQQPPVCLSDYTAILESTDLKSEVDGYLKNRGPVSFILDLRSKLLLKNEGEVTYNVLLLNALVMYVGASAVNELRGKQFDGVSPVLHSGSMDIFHQLGVDLDIEGRYHFINALANQLRYPNSHTQYFSRVVLQLFSESNQEIVKEQIARVLLERLVAIRPHPWGLLVTFMELMFNEHYRFWEHPFTRCTPEFDEKFRSVAENMEKMRLKAKA